MNLSDYVAAGYFLTLPTQRLEGFNDPDLIPPELVSASNHAARLPDDWCVSWVTQSDQVRAEDAAKLGIAPERVPAIVRWTTERLGSEVLFPYLCATREVLGRLRAVVGSCDSRLVEVGMALPRGEVEAYLRLTTPLPTSPGYAPRGTPGETVGISRGIPPAAGGVFLGHEPLTSVVASPSCSWLCNAAEIDVRDALGIRTNAMGLIESAEDARRACDWMNDENAFHGEPGPWFPWLLIRYDR